MSFMDKTSEQLLEEMKEWPPDEFLTHLRSNVLGLVSSLTNAIPFLEQKLETADFDSKADILTIFHGIQRNTQYVQNLMDALGAYEQQRRG